MLLSGRFRSFRITGFFRIYFILGILGLSIVFFVYSYWVTKRLEMETSHFSMMLANFTALTSSIPDKETSDAAKAIIDDFKLPFVVTDADGQPITARGLGHRLREKILANTLTPKEGQNLKKIIGKMDKNHRPIRMRGVGVTAEEGRMIIGYIYYDETKWSLNEKSSIVITDVAEEPVFWRNIDGVDKHVGSSDIPRLRIQSFI